MFFFISFARQLQRNDNMMFKSKTYIIILLLGMISNELFSQTGINTRTPDLNAALDIVSNERGLLIPRLTSTEASTLATKKPANGMLIFNTDLNCIQLYNGSTFECLTTEIEVDKSKDAWQDNSEKSRVELATTSDGSSARTVGTAFVVADNGSVGIGTDEPNSSAILDLRSTSKALLPPRMTTSQMNAITTVGSVVYNTDQDCIYIRESTNWKSVCAGFLLNLTDPFFSSIGTSRVSPSTPRTYTAPSISVASPTLVDLSFAAYPTDLKTSTGTTYNTSDSQLNKIYYVNVEHSINGGAFNTIMSDLRDFNTAAGAYASGSVALTGSRKLELSTGTHVFRLTFKVFTATNDSAGLSYIIASSNASFLQITKL